MPTYYFTDKPGVDGLYCTDTLRADGSILITGEDLLKVMIERVDGTQVYGNIQTTSAPPSQSIVSEPDAPNNQI